MNSAQKEKIEDLRLGRKAFLEDFHSSVAALDMAKQDMTRLADRLVRINQKLEQIDRDLEDAVMSILETSAPVPMPVEASPSVSPPSIKTVYPNLMEALASLPSFVIPGEPQTESETPTDPIEDAQPNPVTSK